MQLIIKWIYIVASIPLCLFTSFGYASQLSLPQIGDSSGQVLSRAKEAELGAQIMRQFRYHLAIMDDPEIADYIDTLGYKLVAATNQSSPINYTFFVVNDERINAFAAPGGYIGINAGLILAAETESELAGVVAHEIAHISQRHLARSWELQDQLSVPTIAALVGAVILGIANPPLGQASLLAILGGTQQYQLNFTRSNEYEADRIGIHTLTRAGFDAMAMPSFFEKLQQSSRLAGVRAPEYLSTHPVTVDRIAETKSRAIQMPQQAMRMSDRFFLTKAKIEVLTSKSIDHAISLFANRLEKKNFAHEQATQYGFALSLLEGEQLEKAAPLINDLYNDSPNRIPFITLLAKLLDKQNQFEKAEAIFKHALEIAPNNYSLTITYAEALIDNGKYREARDRLRAYLPYSFENPVVYKLLSRVSRELKQDADAHRYMAEAYYLEGWTSAAIDQLKRGLKYANLPNYMKQTMEARLSNLEKTFAEEVRNSR